MPIAVAVVMAVAIAGCGPRIPEEQRTPTTIGIVASDATTDLDGTTVRLVDGQVVKVPQWGTSAIVGRPAEQGDLLLSGFR